MSTLDHLLKILENKNDNLERRNYLNSIVNDKTLAEDNLKKIASEILLEGKFLDIYFRMSFIEIIKIRWSKFIKIFKQ